MRVVEYQPDNTLAIYRGLRAVGIGAFALSVLLAIVMALNWWSLKRTDPIHSAALAQLLEHLKSDPQNQRIRNEIRELDLLARRAYFQSQHLTKIGTYCLLASALTAVISFKALGSYGRKLPYPDPRAPKDDLAENARWARNAVTTAGLVLAGFALMLALPWNSPLDETKAGGKPVPQSAALAPAKEQAPAPAATPSKEEMLKNWPAFRGAAAGLAASAELPTAWDGSKAEGIAWKVELPRPGFSSPIVWNDRIFLTGGDEEAREVYGHDARNGGLLWSHRITGVSGAPEKPPKVTEDTGFAASTMATDGQRVFAIFATGEIVALDFEGKRLWARALGPPENPFGHASSLLVFENAVYVQMDHQKKGGVFALNAETGETRWSRDRAFNSSWSSPALIEHQGQPQLVLSACPPVMAYNPRTGEELWRVDCLQHGDVAAVPVAAHGMVFASGDSAALVAIDLKEKKVAWRADEAFPGVSTPAIVGDLMFYGLADGGFVCRNAKSGQLVWQHETDAGIYASPIVSGARVYLMDRDGITHIFKAADKFESIAVCKLGEEAASTPAVAGNSLIFRGHKNLYRVGP